MTELSVVITGGLHGIGAEIVDRFAQDQCCIAIIATKNADMDKIVALFTVPKMGSDVRIIPTDIMDEAQVQHRLIRHSFSWWRDWYLYQCSINFTSNELWRDNRQARFILQDQCKQLHSHGACRPYLKSHSPHVLNIAPPINLDPKVMGYRQLHHHTIPVVCWPSVLKILRHGKELL